MGHFSCSTRQSAPIDGVLLTQQCAPRFPHQVDGVRRATPLLLVLACIELSDIVFAVDSIPAVFAVTKVKHHAYYRLSHYTSLDADHVSYSPMPWPR